MPSSSRAENSRSRPPDFRTPQYTTFLLPMQFQLPSHLAAALADYDPTLKAAQEAAASGKPVGRRRAGFPLGLPVGLIPDDIVPADAFLRALQGINRATAGNRHEHWLDDNGDFLAAVWHVNIGRGRQFWIAAHANPERDTVHVAWAALDQAWLNGPAVFRQLERQGTQSTDPFVECEPVLLHERSFLLRRWSFSEASVAASKERLEPSRLWHQDKLVYSRQFASSKSPFVDQTSGRVDGYARSIISRSWSCGCPFARVQDSYASILKCKKPQDWIPSLGDLDLPPILLQPALRKEFLQELSLLHERFHADGGTDSHIANAWKASHRSAAAMKTALGVWPDITSDHLQQLWNTPWRTFNFSLECVVDPPARRWMRQHLAPRTLIHWFQRHHPDKVNSLLWQLGNFFRDFPDHDLPRPSRMRLEELKAVLEEHRWKLSHNDSPMPQDLFPEPICVHIQDTKLTFFQPRSTHQLARWGSAVRNCVGHSSYAERVMRHQNFIVLGMLDNKPSFTIQLSLRDGALLTDQVVHLANQALPDQQRLLFEHGMQAALAQAAEANLLPAAA